MPKCPFLEKVTLKNCFRSQPIVEWYLENPMAIEEDLGFKVDVSTLSSREAKEDIEEKLMRKHMLKIFGNDGRDIAEEDAILYEEVFLQNFRILHTDGNDTVATAERAGKYYLFSFGTS